MSKRLVLVLSVMWLVVLAVSLSAGYYTNMSGVLNGEAITTEVNSAE